MSNNYTPNRIIRKSVTRDLNLPNTRENVLERDETYKLFKKIIEQEQIENRYRNSHSHNPTSTRKKLHENPREKAELIISGRGANGGNVNKYYRKY